MQSLSLAQVADILETASIETTTDHGHAVVHVGTTEPVARFVLVNDCNGHSCVTYRP